MIIKNLSIKKLKIIFWVIIDVLVNIYTHTRNALKSLKKKSLKFPSKDSAFFYVVHYFWPLETNKERLWIKLLHPRQKKTLINQIIDAHLDIFEVINVDINIFLKKVIQITMI